jgi:hypothetical protein
MRLNSFSSGYSRQQQSPHEISQQLEQTSCDSHPHDGAQLAHDWLTAPQPHAGAGPQADSQLWGMEKTGAGG